MTLLSSRAFTPICMIVRVGVVTGWDRSDDSGFEEATSHVPVPENPRLVDGDGGGGQRVSVK